MNYYVISPNVWNDGNVEPHVDFMSRNHVVCMGWDQDRKHGIAFADKIKTGDRIIVAQKKNWKWTIYFAGIVDGVAKYGDEDGEHYTMCRDIRAFVDLRDQCVLKFKEGMTAYARKNPGALFQLHRENMADAKFIDGIEKLLFHVEYDLAFPVKEIANWRSNGRVAIPSLQRGLVWNPNQVELLWDSILRGFPIGAFVFSKVDAASNQRTSETHDDAEFFLLDGQQRSNAISLAFEEGGNRLQARLWADLLPDMPPARRFLVKVTTKAHPWGYESNDDSHVLNARSIRDAIGLFTQKRLCEIKNVDISKLDLMRTWPVTAGCPIPLSVLLHFFDFCGTDYECFKNRVLAWLQSKENISGKSPVSEDVERFEGEIRKWHDALCGLTEYRIHANVLPQHTIEAEDGDIQADSVSNLESLFTRLSTLGTRISPYDLRYSAIKAYWGGIKEENDKIAKAIMPGANLAIFAFRLAFSIASEWGRKKGGLAKLADVPSISRIRKIGQGKNLDTIDAKVRSIIQDELYAGRLRQIVNGIETALGVFKNGGGDYCGLPPFLRTSMVSASPDVYLFLMVLAYHEVLHLFRPKSICAMATYIHWMNIDPKKSIVDELWGSLQIHGYSWESLERAFVSQIGSKLHPLPKLILEVDATGNLLPIWSQPLHADFYSRLEDNKELLIFAQREYFNKNFNYDPSRADLNEGHNKPWDYDHVIPKEWTNNKKVGDYRQGCKYWTWTIGNYAAIPFSINRGKSNREEWEEYMENASDLIFDRRIPRISRFFVREESEARLFFELTTHRLMKIYDRWRSFVMSAIDLPREMEIVELPEPQET